MSDIYKLQYNGMKLTYPGWNGYVCYEKPSGYPITYLSDEHVHLTGDSMYIPGSEGITLDYGYDTYYRISGYDITGGSIVDGKLMPTGPCTIKAVEQVNYFTATGGWEKGSDVVAKWNYNRTLNVPAKYATASYKTNNVPASWYATSNRWNPNGASAYQITLHPIMKFSGGNGTTDRTVANFTATTLIGSTQTQTQTFSKSMAWGATTTAQYNKTFTSDVQNVTYAISGIVNFPRDYGTAMYVATGTTGTWTATGIAP